MPFYPTSSSGGGGGNLKRIGTDLDYATLSAALANGDGDRAFALMTDETLTGDLEIPASWTEFYCAINPGVTLGFADNTFGVASGGTCDVTFEGLCRETSVLSRTANSGTAVIARDGVIDNLTLRNLTLTSSSTTSGDCWIDEDNAPEKINIRDVTVNCGNHRYPFINATYPADSQLHLNIDGLVLVSGGTSCYDAVRYAGSISDEVSAVINNVRLDGAWSSSGPVVNNVSTEDDQSVQTNLIGESSGSCGVSLRGEVRNVQIKAAGTSAWTLGGDVAGILLDSSSGTPTLTVDASTTIRDFQFPDASMTFTFSQGTTDSPRTRLIDGEIANSSGVNSAATGGVEFVRVNDMGSFGHATLDAALDYLVGYYPFDEDLHTTFRNRAPKGRLSDAGAWSDLLSAAGTTPIVDSGFSTTTNSQFVVVGARSGFAQGAASEFCINFWHAPDDATPASTASIMGLAVINSTSGFGVFLTTGGEVQLWRGSTLATSTGGPQFSDGTYSMVTVQRRNISGTMTWEIYIDGALVASSSSNNTTVNVYDIMLSRQSGTNNGSVGDYSSLSVWTKALSTSEISALYNSGSGRALSLAP